jgi:hypothetical protein
MSHRFLILPHMGEYACYMSCPMAAEMSDPRRGERAAVKYNQERRETLELRKTVTLQASLTMKYPAGLPFARCQQPFSHLHTEF